MLFWQSAGEATCSQSSAIPWTAAAAATVSISKMCMRGRSPLSVAKMIAPLSESDLFMLHIKLIGLHIVVRV